MAVTNAAAGNGIVPATSLVGFPVETRVFPAASVAEDHGTAGRCFTDSGRRGEYSAVAAHAAWLRGSPRSGRQVGVGCSRHLSDRCPVPRGPKQKGVVLQACRAATADTARPPETQTRRQGRAGQAGRQPPGAAWCCALRSSHDAKRDQNTSVRPPAHTARGERHPTVTLPCPVRLGLRVRTRADVNCCLI